MVSIPLFFYLIRYEGIILNYFNLDNLISLPVIGIIYPSIEDAIYTAFINSNIQTTGIFFGFSFVPILLKLKNSLLQNYMIITIIGMMILFASRDFHSMFLNSIPPNVNHNFIYANRSLYVIYWNYLIFEVSSKR